MFKEELLALGKIFDSAINRQNDNQFVDRLLIARENALPLNGNFSLTAVNERFETLADLLNPENIDLLEKHITPANPALRIAVIASDQVPAHCFKTVAALIFAGNTAVVKLSDRDSVLPVTIFNILFDLNLAIKNYIIIDKTDNNFDAIIVENHTGKLLKTLARKFKGIYRAPKKKCVAIISGNESDKELKLLADDIFYCNMLGDSAVKKLYIKENFDLNRLFANMLHKVYVAENRKYADGYTFNRAVWLMNGDKFLENNFVLLKEDNNIIAPQGAIFYQYYKNLSLSSIPREEVSSIETKENFGCSRRDSFIDNNYSNLLNEF